MKRILNNPFRILGGLANYSERELISNARKASKFLSIGREFDFEYDFYFLPKLNRQVSDLDDAQRALERREDRLLFGLFWFVNSNSFDEMALQSMKDGDKNTALQVLRKVTKDRSLSVKNISSFNNISTLQLLSDDVKEVKLGIANKFKVIRSAYFSEFVKSIVDDEFVISIEAVEGAFIDSFTERLDIHDLFELAPEDIKTQLAFAATDTDFFKIERELEELKNNELGVSIDSEVDSFISRITGHYDNIVTLLGSQNMRVKSISTQIAEVILSKHISYYNYHLNSSGQKEAILGAKSILLSGQVYALSDSMRKKYIENIEELDEMLETEKYERHIRLFNSKIDDALRNNSLYQMVQDAGKALDILEGKVPRSHDAFQVASNNAAVAMMNKCIDKGNAVQSGSCSLDDISSTMGQCISAMNALTKIDMTSSNLQHHNKNLQVMKDVKSRVDQAISKRTQDKFLGFVGWIVVIAIIFFVFGN
ncbi:hypothetical protein [Vibrio ezurae]|uniref:Uncharacterized protein n=1 Tax=Vibrio ezurae NBRC 102218 TaxID=1219080 RepID=U3CJB0_9VIBR|nr:hypothetical protein [Vibrio ezurae]GAD81244.1 hypothetical protein VEZ01S_53_00440 [Vibrio ezurae NBRC 102218]